MYDILSVMWRNIFYVCPLLLFLIRMGEIDLHVVTEEMAVKILTTSIILG